MKSTGAKLERRSFARRCWFVRHPSPAPDLNIGAILKCLIRTRLIVWGVLLDYKVDFCNINFEKVLWLFFYFYVQLTIPFHAKIPLFDKADAIKQFRSTVQRRCTKPQPQCCWQAPRVGGWRRGEGGGLSDGEERGMTQFKGGWSSCTSWVISPSFNVETSPGRATWKSLV